MARTLLFVKISPSEETGMVDNLTNRGPQDRSRIALNEEWEVRYWTKEFGISPDELRHAVKEAGSNSVEKVREHLKKK
jgi:hypothetical protein